MVRKHCNAVANIVNPFGAVAIQLKMLPDASKLLNTCLHQELSANKLHVELEVLHSATAVRACNNNGRHIIK